MMTSVPQFTDIEDKVAGPLTWKQIGWMIGMGAVLFLLYASLPRQFFYVAAVPVFLLFMALAFYKPQGIPLIRFLFYSVGFLFRPKVIVWERPQARSIARPVEAPKPEIQAEHTKLDLNKAHDIATMIDKF